MKEKREEEVEKMYGSNMHTTGESSILNVLISNRDSSLEGGTGHFSSSLLPKAFPAAGFTSTFGLLTRVSG